jgi:hypothetical protein
LVIHSQNDKSERLQALVQKFMTRELKPDIPDVHHGIISLLLNLATNPLESIYYKSNKMDRIEEQNRFIETIRREIDLEDEV